MQQQIGHLGPVAAWEEWPLALMKYIDDFNIIEKACAARATVRLSTQKEIRLIHAHKSEAMFQHIQSEAAAVGMKVNQNKTQLLCISS